MELARTQRKFYKLVNDHNKLSEFLISKNLIQQLPNRCTNCHRYNTMELYSRKRKTLSTSSSAVRRDNDDRLVTYRCKK